jgi:hypothetical protein
LAALGADASAGERAIPSIRSATSRALAATSRDVDRGAPDVQCGEQCDEQCREQRGSSEQGS